jgi:hypothetical protein
MSYLVRVTFRATVYGSSPRQRSWTVQRTARKERRVTARAYHPFPVRILLFDQNPNKYRMIWCALTISGVVGETRVLAALTDHRKRVSWFTYTLHHTAR